LENLLDIRGEFYHVASSLLENMRDLTFYVCFKIYIFYLLLLLLLLLLFAS